MKKGLALCLATVMLTASVCGCGAKTTEQDLQPVVVETTLPELLKGTWGSLHRSSKERRINLPDRRRLQKTITHCRSQE